MKYPKSTRISREEQAKFPKSRMPFFPVAGDFCRRLPFKKFCTMLKVTRPEGLGYYVMLMLHVIEFAIWGELEKLTSDELAEICEWPGEPDLLLRSFENSGLLENEGKHWWVLWFEEHALNCAIVRANELVRKQQNPQVRGKNAQNNPSDANEDLLLRNNSGVPPNGFARKDKVEVKGKPKEETGDAKIDDLSKEELSTAESKKISGKMTNQADQKKITPPTTKNDFPEKVSVKLNTASGFSLSDTSHASAMSTAQDIAFGGGGHVVNNCLINDLAGDLSMLSARTEQSMTLSEQPKAAHGKADESELSKNARESASRDLDMPDASDVPPKNLHATTATTGPFSRTDEFVRPSRRIEPSSATLGNRPVDADAWVQGAPVQSLAPFNSMEKSKPETGQLVKTQPASLASNGLIATDADTFRELCKNAHLPAKVNFNLSTKAVRDTLSQDRFFPVGEHEIRLAIIEAKASYPNKQVMTLGLLLTILVRHRQEKRHAAVDMPSMQPDGQRAGAFVDAVDSFSQAQFEECIRLYPGHFLKYGAKLSKLSRTERREVFAMAAVLRDEKNTAAR